MADRTGSSSSEASPHPTHNGLDLEKQDTETQSIRNNWGLNTTSSRPRVSRTQSLIQRNTNRGRFTHPLSHVKTSEAEIVDFDGEDDPYKPMNWPTRKKVITTLLYGLTTMGSTWSTSVYSPAIEQISDQFHVGNEVGLLGTAFLLFGIGLGPMLWGPLSELYGRKPTVLIPYFVAACFSFGTATAKDIQTVLITRFFTGVFASAPVINTGGVLGDIWAPQQRGMAIVGYAFAVVGGPTLGVSIFPRNG
jgi:hypothetical protein